MGRVGVGPEVVDPGGGVNVTEDPNNSSFTTGGTWISINQSKRSTGHVSRPAHTDPLSCDYRATQGIEPHNPCAHLECTYFHR
jgi:hypothetical protein